VKKSNTGTRIDFKYENLHSWNRLIGGSMALDISKPYPDAIIYGIDSK
jgi:hypothetical protein